MTNSLPPHPPALIVEADGLHLLFFWVAFVVFACIALLMLTAGHMRWRDPVITIGAIVMAIWALVLAIRMTATRV